MERIFFLLLFISLEIFASPKNIPFGIKDLCSPIIKENLFTACLEENNLKWISFSFNKKNYSPDKYNISIKGENELKLEGYNEITFFPTNKKNNLKIISTVNNFDSFLEIEKFERKKMEESSSENFNIIKGFINMESVKFKLDGEIIASPKFYISILTNIDTKKILSVHILDLSKSFLEKTTIAQARSISNVDFLYKLK
jgi:hypothetical protein